jgi:hypothetical protein
MYMDILKIIRIVLAVQLDELKNGGSKTGKRNNKEEEAKKERGKEPEMMG